MVHHPTTDELGTQLEKFTKNISESCRQFGRWWDGFCKIFEERIHEETSERYIPYTFYDDVKVNPVINYLIFEIGQIKTQIMDKFNLYSKGWIKRMNF